VVSVGLGFGQDGDSSDISSCTITGRIGPPVTVDSAYSLVMLSEVAREAERVLAARLVPGFVQAYEAAEPVTFGKLTIDREGIRHDAGGSAGVWRMAWDQIKRTEVDGPGRGITIRPKRETGWSRRWIGLGGCTNGVLAHHVIEHAVAGTDVVVKYVSRLFRRTAERLARAEGQGSGEAGPA
jgi:hypothetical protein